MAKKKLPIDQPETESGSWQNKAEEYQAGWQRTQAEFENYRKRMEAARAQWTLVAAAQATLSITPILDDFRRAFAHVPPDQTTSPWVEGMRQVEKHFRAMCSQAGLEPIEDGKVFDPMLHEAIAYEEHPELPEGSIIDVIEIGWKLGEKVMKPARVRVSRGLTKKSEISNPQFKTDTND